jgi:hypothetical protein
MPDSAEIPAPATKRTAAKCISAFASASLSAIVRSNLPPIRSRTCLWLLQLTPARVVEPLHQRRIAAKAFGRRHIFHAMLFPQVLGDNFLLVTQNIDNLHERAGSQRVLHMHGELLKVRCEDKQIGLFQRLINLLHAERHLTKPHHVRTQPRRERRNCRGRTPWS